MSTFTLRQRTHNSDVSTTVGAASQDEAIQIAEEIFDNYRQITYMSLKVGIAKRNDPEIWSKSR